MAMETLTLSDQEQRLYGELFSYCDVENTGKVTAAKALDLLFTTGLPQDTIYQISELCGAKRLGHFGRSQCYIAFKLVALAQIGFPVSLDSLGPGHDIPLPWFGKAPSQLNDSADGVSGQPNSGVAYSRYMTEQDNYTDRLGPMQSGSAQLPPPPKHVRSQRAGSLQQSTQVFDGKTVPSPPSSPIERQRLQSMPMVLPSHIHTDNGEVEQPYDGTNKVEKTWTHFEDDNQGLLSAEPKQEWAHFTDSSKQDNSSVSSEAESVDDVWIISDEQREYYINQFQTIQPDVAGVIYGVSGKEFFEKSRLPVRELAKIWQLSDVNRDGALSLEEFCTAMHLVVLRRNDIELPESLPPSLVPYVPFNNQEEPFAADLPPGSTLKRQSPVSPINTNVWPPYAPQGVQPPPPDTQSPTSSSLSSPGSKPTPVNFDYKPITADSDSKIAHPVALRMSPTGHGVPVETLDRLFSEGQVIDGYADIDMMADSLLDPGPDGTQHLPPNYLHTPLQGRPRPTPKKSQSVPGPSYDPVGQQPLLLPPPTSQEPPSSPETTDRPTQLAVGAALSASQPPMPPPRIKAGHSRSSSLDTQLIDFSAEGQVPPPALPPRTFTKEMECSPDMLERQSSQDEMDSTYAAKINHERRKMLALVRQQRMRNMTLTRLNNELNQELQEVMEQRIALEIQLEHLRPFHS